MEFYNPKQYENIADRLKRLASNSEDTETSIAVPPQTPLPYVRET